MEQDKQQRLAELYSKGIMHLEREKWPDAIECFRAIVDEDPTYRDAAEKLRYALQQEGLESLYKQGCAYMQRGNWQQAITKLEAVVQLDKGYKDAAAQLQEAQRQQEAETLYKQGKDHLDRGEWSQAIGQLQRVLTLAPGYRDAAVMLTQARQQQELWRLYRQGEEHSKREEWQEAIHVFEQVVVLDKNYPDAQMKLDEARQQKDLLDLYARAKYAQEAKRWAEAESLYVQILQKVLGYRDVTHRLDEVQQQKKLATLYRQAEEDLVRENCAAAIEKLQKMLATDGDYPGAVALLKKASYAQGMRDFVAQSWEDAIENFERAEDYSNAKEKLAEAQQELDLSKKYQQGVKALETQQWQTTINHLKELADPQVNYRDAAIRLREAYYRYGLAYQKNQDRKKAIQYFRLAGDYEDVSTRLAELEKERTGILISREFGATAWLAILAILMQLPSLKPYFEHNEALTIVLISVPTIVILLFWDNILDALGVAAQARISIIKEFWAMAWFAVLVFLVRLSASRSFFERNAALTSILLLVPPIVILLPWSNILGAFGELTKRLGVEIHFPVPALQRFFADLWQRATQDFPSEFNQGCLRNMVITLLLLILPILVWWLVPSQWVCYDLVRALADPKDPNLAALPIAAYAVLLGLFIRPSDSSWRRSLAALLGMLYMVLAVRVYLVRASTPDLCAQPTPTPTVMSAQTPTVAPSGTLTPTNTPTSTPTSTPSSTPTPSPAPTNTASPTATATSRPIPTRTPTSTWTSTVTPRPRIPQKQMSTPTFTFTPTPITPAPTGPKPEPICPPGQRGGC